MNALTVAVLAGGRSSEREVSLSSGAAVRDGLLAGGHAVVWVEVAADGTWRCDGELLSVAPGRGLLGVDVAFRLHHKRHYDFRRGRRLRRADHAVEWRRPVRPAARLAAGAPPGLGQYLAPVDLVRSPIDPGHVMLGQRRACWRNPRVCQCSRV